MSLGFIDFITDTASIFEIYSFTFSAKVAVAFIRFASSSLLISQVMTVGSWIRFAIVSSCSKVSIYSWIFGEGII